MDYLIGVGLALAVGLFATITRFDRDRSFYATILVVVASYYDLFAFMSGEAEVIASELVLSTAFICVSVIGLRTNLWLVVAGLSGHGVLDLFHNQVISNPGVPTWWRAFCLSYDVTAAAYLAWRLYRPGTSELQARSCKCSAAPPEASFRARIRPFIKAELEAAAEAERTGAPEIAFRHLERAHILGQTSTIEHVRAHARMLWGLRHGRLQEAAGQVLRMTGAAIKTSFGLVPLGNTGGSNVSPFWPMPIPKDLAMIIESARISCR
jgi:hypothetical protein